MGFQNGAISPQRGPPFAQEREGDTIRGTPRAPAPRPRGAALSVPHAKPVEEIQRVAIRLAGDSGDGMQLTGTKFTEATALAGNDLSTFPDYPAEIRAPAGSLAGVSGFQVHFAAEDIRTPADHPDVLVALEPRGAARQRRRPAAGRDGDPQLRRLRRQEPRARRLHRRSAARPARALPGDRGADHHAEPGGAEGPAARRARGGSLQELLRPRPPLLALRAPHGVDGPLAPGEVQGRAPRSERARAEGRLALRGDDGGCSRSPTSSRGRRSSRASTGTSRATRRWPSASSPWRSAGASPCSSGRTRSRRRATCSTSSRATGTSA